MILPKGTLVVVRKDERGSDGRAINQENRYILDYNTTSERYKVTNSDQWWYPLQFEKIELPNIEGKKSPEELNDYESYLLPSGSILTKVPTGHVMTSSSGHQLFIPQQQGLI